MILDATTPHGLGNRVAAIANGLSYARHVRFGWRVNRHCPLPWQYVFPAGIRGVRIEEEPRPVFPRKFAGRMACAWDAAGDRSAADAAYARVMESMAGEARQDAPRLALCGRFHRNPAGSATDLAERTIAAARRMGTSRVFVFSDRHRDRISECLWSFGIEAVQPACGELAEDLQRSADDVRDYMDDWKTLLAAEVIIALDGPASALHPARAAGREIIYD